MKWNIVQLQKFRNNGLSIDEIAHFDDLMKIDSTIRAVSPIHITGHADIDSNKVTFYLMIQGSFVLPCSRTLVDVKYPIHVETTEIFLLEDFHYEPEDYEVHEVKGDVIDLRPVIQEILLLEVPMQVFSEEGSKEGAPQSGEDWEVIQEDVKKKIDPRLAELARFFEKK
ncbi:DUF177 domain-containing protein [Bacillaceae bacterium Marseille-Q3522]|nr:DUF177 domain-containing protein [Bacillaceae bacterium Marseille-Q3522]